MKSSPTPEPGQRFGSLVAVRSAGKHADRSKQWLYRCDCGNEVIRKVYTTNRPLEHHCGCRTAELNRSKTPIVDRILARCERSASGCLEWQGYRNKGYGYIGNKATYRVMYEAHKGPIPLSMDIDHLCRNRCCCNPDHLEVVTKSENSRRMNKVLAKPHCIRGHSWRAETTYVGKDGKRYCMTCRNIRAQARRARLSAGRRSVKA